MGARFVRIEVRAAEPELAARAAAAAFAAGAAGLEEREGGLLLVYAPEPEARAVGRALDALGQAGLRVAPAAPVEDRDWSLAWREGLRAHEVGERLRVRPSWLEPGPPGRSELVIDPGQAFGTGGHASTRLALAELDALAPALLRGARVLDVGTGSGVLALAALRLGAARAVAFDLDPLATRAARDNARANALASDLQVYTGPIGALRARRFDLVLANVLRAELEPVLPAVARAVAQRGRLIGSGFLVSERARVERAFAASGLRIETTRQEDDPSGDAWLALTARPAGPVPG